MAFGEKVTPAFYETHRKEIQEIATGPMTEEEADEARCADKDDVEKLEKFFAEEDRKQEEGQGDEPVPSGEVLHGG